MVLKLKTVSVQAINIDIVAGCEDFSSHLPCKALNSLTALIF